MLKGCRASIRWRPFSRRQPNSWWRTWNWQAEPSAVGAARQSLDDSGLLLLGEVHGVAENPLLIRALMQAFGLTSLALEWPMEPGTCDSGLPGRGDPGRSPGSLAGRRPDHRLGTWRSWPNAPPSGRLS